MSHAALNLAQEVTHLFSLAHALSFTAAVHLLRGERQALQERAEEVTALSTEQEFAFFLAFGTILQGWVLAEQGQREEGVALMRQGLDAWSATGAEILRSHFLVLLAEAYGKAGQADEGLAVLTEALTVVDKTGERYYEAELYRLKGELTLKAEGHRPESEVTKEAEACFLKATDIARKQQAKSWELRATTSLARLWQQQGKQKEAHGLLSKVYGWFTEGFDTKDLQEAKASLDELAEGG
jgi:predicted ATPase